MRRKERRPERTPSFVVQGSDGYRYSQDHDWTGSDQRALIQELKDVQDDLSLDTSVLIMSDGAS
jgi:hypothetical protein